MRDSVCLYMNMMRVGGICCLGFKLKFFVIILGFKYVHMFVALFSNDWYELECDLGTFVGVCVRKQCRSMQFSLKRARLA